VDPISLYFNVSDTDDAGDTKYYGFLRANGNWYIMREVTSAKTFRYCQGESGYTTAWTGRAGLTFDYFDVVF
jgi:hypothetical protein